MTNQLSLSVAIEEHLLQDRKPSLYLNSIDDPQFDAGYPYNMLTKLKSTPQSPIHHPEGNVWIHIMMVVDVAAQFKDKSSDPRAFMWAALLHDLGKGPTTEKRKGRIVSYDHDRQGAIMAREFLTALDMDKELIEKVSSLVRWHMQILFVVKGMAFADIEGMKKDSDIHEVALLGFCDRMGRGEADEEKEWENIKRFLEICLGESEWWTSLL